MRARTALFKCGRASSHNFCSIFSGGISVLPGNGTTMSSSAPVVWLMSAIRPQFSPQSQASANSSTPALVAPDALAGGRLFEGGSCVDMRPYRIKRER